MANEKILMIDDEDDIRTVAQMSLQTVGGFQVVLAANGEEGLEICKKEKPDLILLDVMMPGLDGPGTLKRLKENPESAHIPVVFLTAKAQQMELNELKTMGAAGVLTKPFDPMKLPDLLREYLTS
ncbi:MAG: response regulator [Nitrospinaceae bacterium]|jgi:two-component system, OmpR family, response regulator|nr:response regulator [Nitrospinaceae bacterium]MBT3435507.1 response regulator [Nitrospinaceae bacterium]MBT3821076.1 response regulator [Nitrospinaceae bacterium]MBT4095809.1 response regulator [Nitrospinaceae bacterium]MBT4432423.1 response regulator [Nitrospinaceae bacterium]